ncbi:plasmolipin-like [Macaca thibetana thibetana]|uniref:plasmolipin-like n=1 Tax=Macaca thibetana thibetana TaxID=257877 RepID=UPI0021BCFA2F|nr:plasmolipin-like [Macaca thibetana thibetana]
MAEFQSKVSTWTSSPAQGAGTSVSTLRMDLGFVRSRLRVFMLLQLVLGLLVWALIADTPYHLYPAYGWVMFVAVFLWLVTIVLFNLYLFQLHMKLYKVPWPLVLMIFNIIAAMLYVTAFIACSAAVDLTYLKGTQPYNQRAVASFFACLVMVAYGVSAFFSYQDWRGVGSSACHSSPWG